MLILLQPARCSAHLLVFDPPGKVVCGVAVAHWRPHSVQDLLLHLDQVLADTIQATEELIGLGIILDYRGAPGQSCSERQLGLSPVSHLPVLVHSWFPGLKNSRTQTPRI